MSTTHEGKNATSSSSSKESETALERRFKRYASYQSKRQWKPKEGEGFPAFYQRGVDDQDLVTTDFYLTNVEVKDHKLFMIGCYEPYVTVALEVRHFRPMFYVPIPDGVSAEELTLALRTTKIPNLRRKHQKRHQRDEEEIENDDLDLITQEEKRQRLFMFDWLRKRRYLRVECESKYVMDQLAKTVRESGVFLPSKGMTVPLRTHHDHWPLISNFMVKHQLRYHSWIRLKSPPTWIHDGYRKTRCNLEGWVDVKDVSLHPDYKTKMPLKPIIASFDIEQLGGVDLKLYAPSTNTTIPKNKYTKFPNHKDKRDIICAIATQIFVLNRPESILDVCLHLRDAKYHDTIGKIKPTTLLIQFDTERDMIRFWLKLVTETFDIGVLSGHNSIAFDLPRIFYRAEHFYQLPERHLLSRFLDQELKFEEKKGRFKTKIEYVKVPGLIQFDTYRCAIKFESKMNTNSLKELAKKAKLDPDKLKMDMPYSHLPMYYMHEDPGLRSLIYFYCAQDVAACRAVMEGRSYWVYFDKAAQLTYTPINDLLMKGATTFGTNIYRHFFSDRGYVYNQEEQDLIHTYLFGSTFREDQQNKKPFSNTTQSSETTFSHDQAEDDDDLELDLFEQDPDSDEDDFKDLVQEERIEKKQTEKQTNLTRSTNQSRKRTSSDSRTYVQSLSSFCQRPLKYAKVEGQAEEEKKAVPIQKSKISSLSQFQHQQNAMELVRESTKEWYTKGDLKAMKKYVGGFVKDMMIGLHTEPVATVDFNSLYPSVIQAYMICSSTLVFCDEATGEPIGAEDLKYRKMQINGKWIAFVREVRIDGKWNKVVGVTPELEREFVGERKIVKKQLGPLGKSIKGCLVPAEKTALMSLYGVIDSTQEALKRIANSIYGIMAAMGFECFCKPVAITTCDVGRNATQSVDRYLQQHYAKELVIVYGDTDSLFAKLVQLPDGTKPSDPSYWRKVYEFFVNLETEINTKIDFFLPPMRMELEKIMVRTMLYCKKHYTAVKVINNPEEGIYGKIDTSDDGPYFRGMPNQRRDFCFAVRDLLTEAYSTYCKSPKEGAELYKEVLQVFQKGLDAFAEKKVPLEQLVRTVAYAHPSRYAPKAFQRFLFQSLIDRGIEPSTGSRVEFVFRKGPEPFYERPVEYDLLKTLVEDKKCEPDYGYYIENQLKTPMLDMLSHFGLRQQGEDLIQRALMRLKSIRSVIPFQTEQKAFQYKQPIQTK